MHHAAVLQAGARRELHHERAHLTHFVQFDALAPRAASGFYVLLANGTREYVEPPNATLPNGTAVNATASNATAALPRLLPRRTLGPA